MIVLKKENTLSKQMERLEEEIRGNRNIIQKAKDELNTSIEGLNKLKENDKEFVSKSEKGLIAVLTELNKKEREELLPFQEVAAKEEKERRSVALQLSFGTASFGLLLLYLSFSYIYIPLLLFLITYFTVDRFYKRDASSEVKKIKLRYKKLKEIEKKTTKSAIENKLEETQKLVDQRTRELNANYLSETRSIQQEIDRQWDEYSKLNKGNLGELKVTEILETSFSDDYFLLNDITIPTINGRTTQIDHIVITPHGIVVLETKNIEGVFYPYSKNQWRWFPSNNTYIEKKILTDNPQQQCIYHAQQLKYLLHTTGNITVQPLVVLTHPNTEYKGEWNEVCPVIMVERLEIVLKSYKLGKRMTTEDSFYIGEKLIEEDKRCSSKHYSPR